MDVNTEIAARAAEYLVLAHGWVLMHHQRAGGSSLQHFEELKKEYATQLNKEQLAGATAVSATAPSLDPNGSQLQRAQELLPPLEDSTRGLRDCWVRFLNQTTALLEALQYDTATQQALAGLLAAKLALPPTEWRQALRQQLYADPLLPARTGQALANDGKPTLRRRISEALEFVPILVKGLRNQLSAGQAPTLPTEEQLLDDPELLADMLDGCHAAVPFPHMLGRELEEISVRRKQRMLRPFGPGPGPYGVAEEQRLSGLAFSGGGIRSATFNLGVVQALATRGWLPHFDYLSTVSGGGYVGSWLVAWIKRNGSVAQVQRYLDSSKTPNPRGEETHPIRWLRSYSNFLAPDASILSTDVWTLGITWLRNALINQLILVLGLAALLLLLQGSVPVWARLGDTTNPVADWVRPAGLAVAALLVLLCAGGVGWVQSWFRERRTRRQELQAWLQAGGIPASRPPLRQRLRPPTRHWPAVLLACLFGAAGLLSAFGYYRSPTLLDTGSGWFYVGLGQVVVLLASAAVGRYDLCFDRKRHWLAHWLRVGVTLVASSAGTAIVGTALLRLVWQGLWSLHQQHGADTLLRAALLTTNNFLVTLAYPPPFDVNLNVCYALVLGPPALIGVVAVVATLRMTLLGRDFPDERREWWGRLGALSQLAVLGWLGLVGIAVLGPAAVDAASKYINWPATTTAWLALVGAGVKMAQGLGTAAQNEQGPAARPAWWREWLARFAPYLFIVGLLLLLACGTRALVPAFQRLLDSLELGTSWFQRHPHYLPLVLAVVLGGLSVGLSARVGVNEFSMHHFYKNRLLRAYLGASRLRQTRQGNPFSGFDIDDDLKLCRLQHRDPTETRQPSPADGTAPPLSQPGPAYDGPLLIINTALNVTRGGELAHQDRKAESFVFTPRYSGFDFARMVPVQSAERERLEYAYRPTQHYAYPNDNGPGLGTVMAISGAAANPNMGYHSAPATAFLLTLFNVRLGWWMGNPRRDTHWQRADPTLGLGYLVSDLFGRARADDQYVNLSDGGHFDNLGLYELVRRRCRYVLVCDAEEDASFRFESLANAIRRCRIDFGVEIDLDLKPLERDAHRRSTTHAVVGRIVYPHLPPAEAGYLIYLKATLTGQEPSDVLEYAHEHAAFPHQTTGDQFFSEPQFESYRRLGYHAALQALPPATSGRTLRQELSWWPRIAGGLFSAGARPSQRSKRKSP